MPFRSSVVFLIFTSFLFTCEEAETPSIEVSIIPQPQSVSIHSGIYSLEEKIGLNYDPEFELSANFLRNYLQAPAKFSFEDGDDVSILKDETINGDGAYKLKIDKSGIKISASSDVGAFYAVQSLRQLVPVEFEANKSSLNSIQLPYLEIEDQPNFAYRGMHLDVSRHFFDVDFIKKYIDAIAMLKMNTFHWHLTDDQGWRIEIKSFPKLQEVAAFRDETLIGHYSDQPHQFDGKRYGGFYTHEDIKEVVAYAKERFVTVIPEIEMPGHAQAAIAAYPELGCKGKATDVATKWGIFETIYCSKDSTFEFLETVLDEVMMLFPSTYIHIGGDEAPKTQWKSCFNCQQRIASEGLIDEHELQSYFIKRIEAHLNKNGRQIIGWDEILDGGLAPNATVMSWRGMEGGIKAAKAGHKVIMTPTSHAYFDYYQSEHPEEPLAIGGYLPLDKVYHFNPIPKDLDEDQASLIWGVQGNLWTEYISTEEKAQYMILPRMMAMSEVAWSQPERKDYLDFAQRVEAYLPRLDAMGYHYANHLYEVEGVFNTEDQLPKFELSTLLKDRSIRYTLDGTEPDAGSKVYSDAIPIESSTQIKAAVFQDGRPIGRLFSENIVLHKAVGHSININREPHKAYAGSGPSGLINGISGSNARYGDKEWLGFSGEDLEIRIDFSEPVSATRISTRFHNGNGQWIYAPNRVEIQVNDGRFKAHKLGHKDSLLVDFSVPLDSTMSIEKITLKIPSYGLIPDGKQGSGNRAWTFIDEIFVE